MPKSPNGVPETNTAPPAGGGTPEPTPTSGYIPQSPLATPSRHRSSKNRLYKPKDQVTLHPNLKDIQLDILHKVPFLEIARRYKIGPNPDAGRKSIENYAKTHLQEQLAEFRRRRDYSQMSTIERSIAELKNRVFEIIDMAKDEKVVKKITRKNSDGTTTVEEIEVPNPDYKSIADLIGRAEEVLRLQAEFEGKIGDAARPPAPATNVNIQALVLPRTAEVQPAHLPPTGGVLRLPQPGKWIERPGLPPMAPPAPIDAEVVDPTEPGDGSDFS